MCRNVRNVKFLQNVFGFVPINTYFKKYRQDLVFLKCYLSFLNLIYNQVKIIVNFFKIYLKSLKKMK